MKCGYCEEEIATDERPFLAVPSDPKLESVQVHEKCAGPMFVKWKGFCRVLRVNKFEVIREEDLPKSSEIRGLWKKKGKKDD